jgi:hypothetical protein
VQLGPVENGRRNRSDKESLPREPQHKQGKQHNEQERSTTHASTTVPADDLSSPNRSRAWSEPRRVGLGQTWVAGLGQSGAWSEARLKAGSGFQEDGPLK